VHLLDASTEAGSSNVSNNQHPGNNLVSNSEYDDFTGTDTDFDRAERLIAWTYETLRSKPDVFAKTLLLITYDEHGGLYDHVPPPSGVPSPGGHRRLVASSWRWLFHRKAKAFDFTMLGPRVPAVVVSPLVRAGSISSTVRDHASVPATLRALFAPDAKPLTPRDAWAAPFHTFLTLDAPRNDLPDLSDLAAAPKPPTPSPTQADQPVTVTPEVPEHYKAFLKLSKKVQRKLARKGVLEPAPVSPAVSPHAYADHVSQAFLARAGQDREAAVKATVSVN
jgi:phospholipase C